jgi:hypothetical protein
MSQLAVYDVLALDATVRRFDGSTVRRLDNCPASATAEIATLDIRIELVKYSTKEAP